MYVTVAQFGATTDKVENLATARRLIADAATRGTSLVVLPENTMHYNPDPAADVRPAAEPVDGPFAQAISQEAKTAGVAVIVGMTEAPGADGRCTNAVLAIDEHGRTIGVYRKVHPTTPSATANRTGSCRTPLVRWSSSATGCASA